jgi:branched-chain amino acid transport system ATP-binding protein
VAMVETAGLVKAFGVRVIDDFSFSVARGEAVGIVGPNGAGKTTLLNLIAGDLRPDQGRVVFDGEDVTAWRPDARCRRGLARTSQVPRPFEGLTVFENALVGASFGGGLTGRPANERAALALERADLLAKANVLAGNLGLLDRKRLELARALASEPDVILLDEIAGGLTEAEVHVLVDKIRDIHAAGMTIVWIEHIVHALLAVVGRITAMSFGRKIAEGDPHEVMGSHAVREVYLGVVE